MSKKELAQVIKIINRHAKERKIPIHDYEKYIDDVEGLKRDIKEWMHKQWIK